MTEPIPTSQAPAIACSLEPGSAQERIARWQALADRALESAARTGDGAVQRYSREPSVEQELEELIALEGRCCPFLSFELRRRADALELAIRGPAGARPILDAFGGDAVGRPH